MLQNVERSDVPSCVSVSVEMRSAARTAPHSDAADMLVLKTARAARHGRVRLVEQLKLALRRRAAALQQASKLAVSERHHVPGHLAPAPLRELGDEPANDDARREGDVKDHAAQQSQL